MIASRLLKPRLRLGSRFALIRTRREPHSLRNAIEGELRVASGGLPVAGSQGVRDYRAGEAEWPLGHYSSANDGLARHRRPPMTALSSRPQNPTRYGQEPNESTSPLVKRSGWIDESVVCPPATVRIDGLFRAVGQCAHTVMYDDRRSISHRRMSLNGGEVGRKAESPF